MGKYFENRQNNTGINEAEMDDVFKVIADHFDHKWLKGHKGHPLQNLWYRRDALSTNELYFFGYCLKNLALIDPKWARQQCNQIKSDHVNNRLGAFFEIHGLGILFGENQVIRPTKGNNPGFDGILTIDPTKTMRLSLKNYGDSAHHREFNSYSKRFESELIKELKQKKIVALQVIVESPRVFPEKKNWEALCKSIPFILSEAERGLPKLLKVDDFWAVYCGNLKDDYQDFHPAHNSYTLIITGPYHKNEHKNLIDKLDEACANLVKHANVEDKNVINTVFVHLPESAAIIQCKEWADQYFLNFPDKPITSIILYQPTIARSAKNESTSIHHCFQWSLREDRFLSWNTTGKNILFTTPVGVVNSVPAQNQITFEVDGKGHLIDLKNRYIYQKGNWYLQQQIGPDGTIAGNIKLVASGILAHSIFQPFPGQAAIQFTGHFPPDDKLLIL